MADPKRKPSALELALRQALTSGPELLAPGGAPRMLVNALVGKPSADGVMRAPGEFKSAYDKAQAIDPGAYRRTTDDIFARIMGEDRPFTDEGVRTVGQIGDAAGTFGQASLDASPLIPGGMLTQSMMKGLPNVGTFAGAADDVPAVVKALRGADDVAPQQTTLGMGSPFEGKPGQRSLLDILRGKKPDTPKGFTPPTSLDDIYAGGSPRGPRELSGGSQNPAGLESSFMNDPRFNGVGVQDAVPYTEGQGFGGLDARLGQPPENPIVKALMAKRAKPLGYDDWSPEWKAASDKGLDMSTEARMARARAQGFNVDERLYHGTLNDFDEFDPSWSNENAVFLTPNSKAADLFNTTGWGDEGGRTLPVFAKGKLKNIDAGNQLYEMDRMYDALLSARGKDGIRVRNIKELDPNGVLGPNDMGALNADQIAIFDPANIRSTSAAFDPDNIGKPSLLGAGSAAVNSDIIKLLMAYGAFGGMSAGALATMDAQKHQQGGM